LFLSRSELLAFQLARISATKFWSNTASRSILPQQLIERNYSSKRKVNIAFEYELALRKAAGVQQMLVTACLLTIQPVCARL
jgi:hypothetical protein